MTSAANTAPIAIPATSSKKDDGGWQWWGTLLVAPYLVVFVVFVLYPVGYGFWLGHDIESYIEIFHDPTVMVTRTFIRGSSFGCRPAGPGTRPVKPAGRIPFRRTRARTRASRTGG